MNKKYTIYLLINTRTNQMKLVSRETYLNRYTGAWIPIKLNITLEIPNNEMEINANIILSETKVTEMVIAEITKDEE